MTDINFNKLGPKLSRVFLASCIKPHVGIIYSSMYITNGDILATINALESYGRGKINYLDQGKLHREFRKKYIQNINNIKTKATVGINYILGSKMLLFAIDSAMSPGNFSARRSYFYMNGGLCLFYNYNENINNEYSNQKLKYKNLLSQKKGGLPPSEILKDTEFSEIKRQLLIGE